MELLVGLVSAIILAALILLGMRSGGRGTAAPGSNRARVQDRGTADTGLLSEATRPCPVCGSRLRKGELVKTRVFSGGDKPLRDGEVREAMAHMFGCTYCYPSGVDRHCPVCKAILQPDDYVIARMFLRVDKKHMHVLGCTKCRTGRG